MTIEHVMQDFAPVLPDGTNLKTSHGLKTLSRVMREQLCTVQPTKLSPQQKRAALSYAAVLIKQGFIGVLMVRPDWENSCIVA